MYVFCPFVPFLLAIRLSALLRYTDSDYPFDIFKHLLPLSLVCPFPIASAVLSNVYLYIYSDLDFQHYSPFSELRGEMIIRLVDIDGVVDHYCLNVLFLIVIETKRIPK